MVTREGIRDGLTVMAVAALLATAAIADVRIEALEKRVSAAEAKASRAQVLTEDTLVHGEWRTADGRSYGRYTTPLRDLNDNDVTVRRLESDVQDLRVVVYEIVTDPEMRGHLLRHDMTDDELDALAARFAD